MDPYTPPSFMSLLDGDDSPQVGDNNTPPSYPQYPPYYPSSSNEQLGAHNTPYPYYPPYHPPPYFQPPPHSRNPNSGSNQNPRFHRPPYFHPPSIENPQNAEYPYYPPYYPPPPTFQQYFSGASNSTPSSTPTASMAGLGLSGTDIDPSNDEADVEEVVGGISGPTKKWSTEEDEILISGWINCGTDPIVGTDQKKASFWGNVATYFNEHRPRGSEIRTAKTCNGRWLRCSALLSKWKGIVEEIERLNESGSNEARVLEKSHQLFKDRYNKRFVLEHWYAMLKDQPKWRKLFDPTETGSGSKRSNPDNVEEGEEGEGGNERPEGRKAAKRKSRQKANNTVVEMVTTHFKEDRATKSDKQEMLKGLVSSLEDKVAIAKDAVRLKSDVALMKADAIKTIADSAKMKAELKLRKQAIKEARYEDNIMTMDTSVMNPVDAAFYEEKKEAIRLKRSQQSSTQ